MRVFLLVFGLAEGSAWQRLPVKEAEESRRVEEVEEGMKDLGLR